mgnify:CR=1 FL=1
MSNDTLYSQVKYRANPDFIMREIGEDLLLVPVNHTGVFENAMLSLNKSCGFLWNVFQTPHTAQEAIEEVMENYSGDADAITADVLAFIRDYAKFNLLIKEEGK